jgi:hypothetical protein
VISLLFFFLLQAEAPVVHIHAPARIELDSPHRQANSLAVTGRLVDDETGEAIPSELVVVTSLEDQLGFANRRGAMTDENGHFQVTFNLPPGHHRIVANFAGGATLTPARAERTADLGLRPLDIRVEGPARVRRGERVKFRVYATTDGENADVAVKVAGAPVRMRDGAAEVEMVAAGRGPQKFEASYDGDGQFNSAHGEARFVVEVPVTLTLESKAGASIRRGDAIPLRGHIRDADGPLALAAVDIRVLGEPVAVAQADAEGDFETELETGKLAAGRLQIDARFRPTAPWHAQTTSAALTINLVAPAPPPIAAFLVPPILGAVIALVWRFGRKWRLFRARRTAPVETPPPAPAAARGLRIIATPRTLRATDLTVDGIILDARTNRPVAAMVADTQADDAGRFSLILAAGSHDLLVRAEGYCDETFNVAVPHRGQLRGVEVRIAPIRLRVLEAFRAASAPAMGDRNFDVATPREIAPRGGPALAQLAQLVEDTNYSGRAASPEQLERAQKLAREELTRAKPVHTIRPQ